jgi:uncharacterized protein
MSLSASDVLSRASIHGPTGEINAELCWKAIEAAAVGRLAVVLDDKIHIFPLNYAVDGTKIYFRTAPGSKLIALKEPAQVALEIDAFDDVAAYSVVVKGRAIRVDSPAEVAAAEALQLEAWIPTLKLRWVRLSPMEVTGRVFRRGKEPIPYV